MPDIYAVSEWSEERGFAIAADYPTPLGWSDACAQPDNDILSGYETVALIGRLSDTQRAALQTDIRYPAVLASGPLDASTLEAMSAHMTTAMHPDLGRLIATAADAAEAVTVMIEANTRPVWKPGLSVTAGDVLHYQRNLYEVVQSHTTQADWTPIVALALWKRFYEIGAPPEPWVQPLGAHDAYRAGMQVTHDGFTWQSDIDANVWEPGVFGWTNLTPPPSTPEWAAGVFYAINTEVTYQGATYRCRQSHTSQVGWEPPNVLALWLPL